MRDSTVPSQSIVGRSRTLVLSPKFYQILSVNIMYTFAVRYIDTRASCCGKLISPK